MLDPASSSLGAFDFVNDAQTFHCVRQVDPAAAAAFYAARLKPGGVLHVLTGNADEPEDRGPVRLSRAEVEGAFPALVLERVDAVRFDETAAYARQPFDSPPLGWRSIWRRPPA